LKLQLVFPGIYLACCSGGFAEIPPDGTIFAVSGCRNMSLSLPTNDGQLILLGNNMVHGLTHDGSALGITQISAPQLQSLLTAYISADSAFNAGRTARQNASNTFQADSAALVEWLATAKNVLAGSFGIRWNAQWAQAGFINNSTALPTKFPDQFALGQRLTGFLTNNPGYEVPSVQVTAAQGQTLLDAVTGAQQTLAAAVKAMTGLDASWTSAYTALTDVMWSLIKILQATLDDDDARWLDFGLQMPSMPSTPGKPQNVSAHLDQTGAIIVQCDSVSLATRYRFRMLRVGIDTNYSLAASSPAPMGSISDVLPGQTAQIIVQAVNGSLQGVASEPIVFTVPVARNATEPKRAEAPAATVAASNGHSNGHATNGNGQNGHAAHSRSSVM
jgi:hypothetical protein